MSAPRLNRIAVRRRRDIRQAVHVELPPFGVGLGLADEAFAWILINNRMSYGEADWIACVPVVPTARRPNERRLRRRRGDDGRLIERSDFALGGENIFEAPIQLYPPTPSRPTYLPPEKEISPPASTGKYKHSNLPRNLDQTLRHPTQNVLLKVPRDLWFEEAEGVLFLLVYGPLTDDALFVELGKHISEELCEQDVSRCVIPGRALHAFAQGVLQRDARPLCFAHASCQYTAGMLDMTPPAAGFETTRPGPADHSYARLASYLNPGEGPWQPNALLLTGDQVYVDASAGLFDPSTLDGRFLRPYEQFYGSVFVQHVTRQIPVYMMLDDHELRDNWENESDAQLDLTRGRAAYIDFQRLGGPLPEPVGDKLWAAFKLQGYDFFVTDTRTERTRRSASTVQTSTIMKADQFHALKAWLSRPNPDHRPRFVVSGSLLIPRRQSTLGLDATGNSFDPSNALHSDAWDGYPRSFEAIFEYIAREQIRNVVFLSGDEHRCCVASATLQGGDDEAETIQVWSIHSSALYAPFVFANAVEEDFVLEEIIEVRRSADEAGSGSSKWKVRCEFASLGQGFAVIKVGKEDNKWCIRVRFSLHRGSSTRVEVHEPTPIILS